MDFTEFELHAQAVMESWHCPGIALAVVQGNELAHQAAYGLRHVEATHCGALPLRAGQLRRSAA